jgi:hypothetical protein
MIILLYLFILIESIFTISAKRINKKIDNDNDKIYKDNNTYYTPHRFKENESRTKQVNQIRMEWY